MEKSWPIFAFLSVVFAVLLSTSIPHRVEVHQVDAGAARQAEVEELVRQLQSRFDAYDQNFLKIQDVLNGKEPGLTPTPTKR